MKLLIQNFRTWWQPPRRVGKRQEERKVSYLELFYDLVYVVIIAELAHTLSSNMNWAGIASFAFMFFAVWWAWFNGAAYHDLHGNNDIRTRVFTFLQMIAVIAMAIFAHNAIGQGSQGFALSYAFFQGILTLLWWRTGVYDPDHAPLSRPYAAAFLLNTLLWALSAYLPPPTRYFIWAASLTASLLLPTIILTLGKRKAEINSQVHLVTKATPSIVERFGLFTIIVLGEVVVGVVSGVSGNLDLLTGVLVVMGTLIAISLWWLYFDFLSHKKPKPGLLGFSLWYALHLPMTLGIAAVGAAIVSIIKHAHEHLYFETRIILSVSIAVVILCIACLVRIMEQEKKLQEVDMVASNTMLLSAVLVTLLGFSNLQAISLLAGYVLLLLAPVFFGFNTWLRVDLERKRP